MKKINVLLIILSLLFSTMPVLADVNNESGLEDNSGSLNENENVSTISVTTIVTENEDGKTFCEENLKLKVTFENLPADRSKQIGVDVKCDGSVLKAFNATLPKTGNEYVYDYDQMKSSFKIGKTYTITYYTTKGRGTAMKSIDIVYKYKAVASVKSSAIWSTFVAPFEVTIPDGIKVFTPSKLSQDSELVLTNISTQGQQTQVAANTPVILRGDADWTQEFFSTTDAGADYAVSMEGRVVGVLRNNYSITAAGNTKYIMQSKNNAEALFYKLSKDRVAAKNRVYLDLTPRLAASISFVYDEEVTEIETIGETPNTDITTIYDMSGRRVTHLGRGINILKYSDGSTKKMLR